MRKAGGAVTRAVASAFLWGLGSGDGRAPTTQRRGRTADTPVMINERWNDLYRHWRGAWVIAEGGLLGAHPGVVEIAVPCSPHAPVPHSEPTIDWWPTAEVEVRQAARCGQGADDAWPLHPGIVRTAELLHEHSDDDEGLAAVWIAAFTRDQAPTAARLGIVAALDAVHLASVAALRQRDRVLWHHTTRLTLPTTVMTPGLSTILAGQGPSLIVEFARLNALATMAHWSLVRVARYPLERPAPPAPPPRSQSGGPPS